MTTTGGPEHSLADPAMATTRRQTIRSCIGHADRLDGDDIVVEPAAPHAIRVGGRRRVDRRRDRGGCARRRRRRSRSRPAIIRATAPAQASCARSQPASPPAAHPTPAGRTVKPKPVPVEANSRQGAVDHEHDAGRGQPAGAGPATPAPTTPATAPPPPVTAPPPVTTPPAEPASVLRWTATPAALSVKGGAHASVTVTVVNPTKGTVTLGTPLSCAPTAARPARRGDRRSGVRADGAVDGAALDAHAALHDLRDRHRRRRAASPLPPGVYTASVREPVQDQGERHRRADVTEHPRDRTGIVDATMRHDCCRAATGERLPTGRAARGRRDRRARVRRGPTNGASWSSGTPIRSRKCSGCTRSGSPTAFASKPDGRCPHSATVESDGCLFVIQDLVPGAPVELLTHSPRRPAARAARGAHRPRVAEDDIDAGPTRCARR